MTASRRQALGLAAAALVLSAAQVAQAADRALAKAVASETRPAADRARDGARHPVESLTFWGLKPGQTVVGVSPGGGVTGPRRQGRSGEDAPAERGWARSTTGGLSAARRRVRDRRDSRLRTPGRAARRACHPVCRPEVSASATLR